MDSIDASAHINGSLPITNHIDPSPIDSNHLVVQTMEDRRAPEGKDNDSITGRELIEHGTKENTYSTDVNGKVTVHVVVTINGNGTLADLKKQRMQIRNSNTDVSSLTTPVSSSPDGDAGSVAENNADILRLTGETEEVVDYSKSKGCCSVQ